MAVMFDHDVVDEIRDKGVALLCGRQSELERQNVPRLRPSLVGVSPRVEELFVERRFQLVRQFTESALVVSVPQLFRQPLHDPLVVILIRG